jgi:hypothetical protein
MHPFVTARADGRADWKVVFDLVAAASPGTVYPYDELERALRVGIDGDVSRERIGRACRAATDRLLIEHERALQCVPGLGYRMAHARDHITLANDHRHRGHRQMERALAKTVNVRMEELTPVERNLIDGMRIVFGSFAQMLAASERRQERFERVLDEVRKQQTEMADRLARIEDGRGSVTP